MSADQDVNLVFNSALDAQQKGRIEEAILAYQQLLAPSSASPLTKDQASVVHHNLSVLYLKRDETKLAQIENFLALRKNPGNSQALELRKQNDQLKQNQIQIDKTWSNSAALTIIPAELLFVFLVAILIGLFRSLRVHFKLKRIAEIDNNEPPILGLNPRLLIAALFPVLALLAIRFYDDQRPRGLVILDNSEISAAPGSNQAVITTINAGTEVLILRTTESEDVKYVQVQSTNQFSGWTKANNIAIY